MMLNSTIEITADANNLHTAFTQAKSETDWKESVQRYEVNELKNIAESRKLLLENKYSPSHTKNFTLHERGHIRLIKPSTVRDRVVYKSFNKNVLLPRTTPKLIYDNGASLKDKGLAFARRRFEIHLRKAYREYGPNAYVLFMDFSKYFDNIDHKLAEEEFAELLDQSGSDLLHRYFDSNKIDVSYMSDEEYIEQYDKPFNTLAYELSHPDKRREKYYYRSVGIGSENAQTVGIYYPHRIDNYIKIVRGIKYYGRYMDDSYIILPNKNELKKLYSDIKLECSKLRIFPNDKKVRYTRIDSWCCFLKINYRIVNGKIIKKVSNEAIRREKRRILKYHNLYISGRLSLDDVVNSYKSWRGAYIKFDSGYSVYKLDRYFCEVFKVNRCVLKKNRRINLTCDSTVTNK